MYPRRPYQNIRFYILFFITRKTRLLNIKVWEILKWYPKQSIVLTFQIILSVYGFQEFMTLLQYILDSPKGITHSSKFTKFQSPLMHQRNCLWLLVCNIKADNLVPLCSRENVSIMKGMNAQRGGNNGPRVKYVQSMNTKWKGSKLYN